MTLEQSIQSARENYPNALLWLVTKKSSFKENFTIPIDYWLIGEMGPDGPKVGEPLIMSRYANSRNPEGMAGWFKSTPIIDMEPIEGGYIIKTANSTYEVKQINEPNFREEISKVRGPKSGDDKYSV